MKDVKRQTLEGVKIVGVTSPTTISRIANEHKLNPQEVFVRVTFEYKGQEWFSSNQLRFFGEEGYKKLLEAKASQEPINITVTSNEKGSLMYLESDNMVEIDDLFKQEYKPVDKRKDITELF